MSCSKNSLWRKGQQPIKYSGCFYTCTVKPVLRGYLKIDKTKVLMENGSLMKVESIAEYLEHSAIILTCI